MTIFLVCQVPIPIVKLREGECKKGDLPNLGNLSELSDGPWLVPQLCIYGPCQTSCCLMSYNNNGINHPFYIGGDGARILPSYGG